MLEIGVGHIAAVITALVSCVGVLWGLLLKHSERERTRYAATEAELKERSTRTENELREVRSEHVGLLQEVAELKGRISGQREMSEKVLQHITELNNNGTASNS